MNLEQTWSEIKSLDSMILRINQREPEALNLLYRLSKKVLGEGVIPSCSNCHIKAFRKLTSLTFNELEAMSERKFKLKDGIVLDPENNGTHYTNANLTDEIAAGMLKKNPKLAKHFATVGDLNVDGDNNPLTGLSKDQLLAKYKEVFGTEGKGTKAELQAAIEAKLAEPKEIVETEETSEVETETEEQDSEIKTDSDTE